MADIRIRTRPSEPFTAYVYQKRDIAAAGVTSGVTAAIEGLKTDLRQVIEAALGRRMANAIGSAVYPKGKNSLGAAGSVFPRGDRAEMLLSLFSTGETIRSADGFFLAIPTAAAGKMVAGGRITPHLWEQAHGQRLHFIYDPSGISRLVADGVVVGSSGRIKQTRGRRGSRREQNEVVVFWLVPTVDIPKKFDADAIAALWGGRVTDLIEQSLPSDL